MSPLALKFHMELGRFTLSKPTCVFAMNKNNTFCLYCKPTTVSDVGPDLYTNNSFRLYELILYFCSEVLITLNLLGETELTSIGAVFHYDRGSVSA